MSQKQEKSYNQNGGMKPLPHLEGLSMLAEKHQNLDLHFEFKAQSKMLTRCTSLEYQTESTRASVTTANRGQYSQASFRNLQNPNVPEPVFPTAPPIDSFESLNKTQHGSEIRIKRCSKGFTEEHQARVSHLTIPDSSTQKLRQKHLRGLFGTDYSTSESQPDLSGKSLRVLKALEPRVTPASGKPLPSPLLSRKVSRAIGLLNVFNSNPKCSNLQPTLGRLDKPGIQILVSRRPSHREIFPRRPSSNFFKVALPQEPQPAPVESKCLLLDRRVESPTKSVQRAKAFVLSSSKHQDSQTCGLSPSKNCSTQQTKLNRCELVMLTSKRESLAPGLFYLNPGNRAVESPQKIGKEIRKQLLQSIVMVEKRSPDVGILPHVSISPS